MMKVEEAMDIVYELANQNKLSGQAADENEEEAERQQQALDVIHDFTANVVVERARASNQANDTPVIAVVDYVEHCSLFFVASDMDSLYHKMAKQLRRYWDMDDLDGQPPEDDKELVEEYGMQEQNRVMINIACEELIFD